MWPNERYIHMAWLPKKRVVVPTDFSQESLDAVDTALEVAATPTGVHVIHVLPELVVLEPSVAWATIDDEDRLRGTEKRLQTTLENEKYRGLDVKVLVGDPGHVIADYAQDVEADLIVLPSHGRTGLKRMLIGSVAERVVRLAHCPVLVIRK
jgi:nucleotide-binding universal stress UspA family protein